MTFYQELQLDQAGSKKLIQNTEGLKNIFGIRRSICSKFFLRSYSVSLLFPHTAGSSEVRTAL